MLFHVKKIEKMGLQTSTMTRRQCRKSRQGLLSNNGRTPTRTFMPTTTVMMIMIVLSLSSSPPICSCMAWQHMPSLSHPFSSSASASASASASIQTKNKSYVQVRRQQQQRHFLGIFLSMGMIFTSLVGPSTPALAVDNLSVYQETLSSSSLTILDATQATNGNSNRPAYQILQTRRPNKCMYQTKEGDVIEIQYEAKYLKPFINNNGNEGVGAVSKSNDITPPLSSSSVVYDSSLFRGTGQPYQMVLGSGDMIPGVDLGLYEMCPGEERVLKIPPYLGYGGKGNRLFKIPPNAPLEWQVELISIEGIVREDNNDDDNGYEYLFPNGSSSTSGTTTGTQTTTTTTRTTTTGRTATDSTR